MHVASALEILAPLLGSPLFHADIEAEGAVSLTQDYAVLDAVEKLCKARKAVLKPAVESAVSAVGKVSKTGSATYEAGLATATRQRKVSKTPNDARLRELLAAKDIPLEEVYDTIKSFTLNPSKLDSLISLGRLTQQEVDALKGESFALRVTLDKKTKTHLEESAAL
jgi:hypothetical protein